MTTSGPSPSVSIHLMTHTAQLPRQTSLQGVLVLVLGILLLILVQRTGSGVL